jgi:hypothetical protein
MTGPFYLFSVLATLWLHVWTVAGSLYPIKPVSSTIYEAGLPAEVKWMEDGKSPLLNLTGNLKIDLYAGRSVSVFSLYGPRSFMGNIATYDGFGAHFGVFPHYLAFRIYMLCFAFT